MSGWIALRYLNDPATAREHFAHVDDGSANPIVLARANYWRAAPPKRSETTTPCAPAIGRRASTTAYYGQLARAKLGLERH